MPEHSILEERLYNHRSALSLATARRPADEASNLALSLGDPDWLLAWNDLAQQHAWSDFSASFPPAHRPSHDSEQLALRASRPPPTHSDLPPSSGQLLWSSHLQNAPVPWSTASTVSVAAGMAPTAAPATAAENVAPLGASSHAPPALAWTRQLAEYPSQSTQAPPPHSSLRPPFPLDAATEPTAGPQSFPHSRPSGPDVPFDSVSSGVMRSKKRRRPSNGPASLPPANAPVALWKGRCGPLDDSTREKSRSLRQYGACWRCRKYRKPCSSGPEICETCITSGFRVWPSELGCRRGNLESYVDVLLPTNAEFVFSSSRLGHNKRDPWRRRLDESTIEAARNATALTTEDKRWGVLIRKVLGTRIFGPEFVELFEIIARFQQAAVNEHPALDAALSMLNATTDFYYTFVKIDGDDYQMQDPVRTVRTIRKSFSRALRMVLNGCLSGRANEWLPCLLGCCVLAAAVVTFADAAIGVPPDVREAVWPDFPGMINTIKVSCYNTVCHLLNALAKGGKPLKMSCWRVEDVTDPATGQVTTKKNENGMKLLGNDEASFNGVRALQQWLEAHGNVVTVGRTWTSSQPFSQAQIPAICAMGMLFDA